mgnify:CR=1 FL=1
MPRLVQTEGVTVLEIRNMLFEMLRNTRIENRGVNIPPLPVVERPGSTFARIW